MGIELKRLWYPKAKSQKIMLVAEALYLPSINGLTTSYIIKEIVITINDALLYVIKINHRIAFMQKYCVGNS